MVPRPLDRGDFDRPAGASRHSHVAHDVREVEPLTLGQIAMEFEVWLALCVGRRRAYGCDEG
jgi:hypothetical protein